MPHIAVAPVKVLKKIKSRNRWILCLAVPDSNGRYNDQVRVEGRIEVHSEGHYYLEWREAGQRRRKAITSQTEIQEQMQIKVLELGAASTDARLAHSQEVNAPDSSSPAIEKRAASDGLIHAPSNEIAAIAQYIFRGLASYFQQLTTGTFPGIVSSMPVVQPVAAEAKLASGVPQFILAKTASTNKRDEEARDAGVHTMFYRVPGTNALPADNPTNIESSQRKISEAIDSFLKDIEPPQREWKTYEEYRNVLYRFRNQCAKVYVRDVNRDDCLEFMRHLYSIGNEARTVYNRIGIVQQWLRLYGVTNLLRKNDKPNYVENIRDIYSAEELQALLEACNPAERIRYLFFLLTGERDKEVRYTTWDDVDFSRRCVRVTAKKQLNFKPKDKEEREILIPAALLSALKEYKAEGHKNNPYGLLFPTSQGRPDKKFENKLKRIAFQAGLNCERCVSKYGNRCSTGPHCGKWFLHKFRHTFATNCLEAGISVRTLQEWLGHSDLSSTMIYLKYVRRDGLYDIIDKSAMADVANSVLDCA